MLVGDAGERNYLLLLMHFSVFLPNERKSRMVHFVVARSSGIDLD